MRMTPLDEGNWTPGLSSSPTPPHPYPPQRQQAGPASRECFRPARCFLLGVGSEVGDEGRKQGHTAGLTTPHSALWSSRGGRRAGANSQGQAPREGCNREVQPGLWAQLPLPLPRCILNSWGIVSRAPAARGGRMSEEEKMASH